MLWLAGATLTAVALTAHPTAQVLTAAEVERAMASRQAADHEKLQAHFAALSRRYGADARRHTEFARAASGASRGAGLAAAKHHERLAELAKESAKLTNELAVHHERLRGGQPSTTPKGAEAFEAGAGAPAIPSERRLLLLAARASKPSEHGELREYYLLVAKQADEDARAHRTMAQMFRGRSHPSEPAAMQCDRLAQLAAGAADEARALAREHQ